MRMLVRTEDWRQVLDEHVPDAENPRRCTVCRRDVHPCWHRLRAERELAEQPTIGG